MPPPAISARIKSLQLLSIGGVRARAARAAGDRSSEQGKLLVRLSMSVRPEALRTRRDLRPSAPGDVRVRHAAERGARDDLLRERDGLVDDGVGDVAPPDARLGAGSPGFRDLQVSYGATVRL
jgi:hypothetical protein